MLGFPLLYFKGMRLMMFQLSSFYCNLRTHQGDKPVAARRQRTAGSLSGRVKRGKIGALRIRRMFRGPLYFNYQEEPPK